MASCRAMLVVAAAALLVVQPVAGYIYERTIRPYSFSETYATPRERRLGQYFAMSGRSFGFRSGGQLTFEITCPQDMYLSGRMDLMFMSSNQYSELDNDLDSACVELNGVEPIINITLDDNGTGRYVGEAGKDFQDAFYFFVVRMCPFKNEAYPVVHTCHALAVALNPGGEHLSSDEIPLPAMYRGLLLFWAVILGIWIVHWILFYKYANRLFYVISSGPFLKVIVLWLEYYTWTYASEKGEEPSSHATARSVFLSLENTLLFLITILVAEGWCIIYPHVVNEARWLLLFGPPAFFVGALGPRLGQESLMAFAIIAIMVCIVYVLRDSSTNVYILRQRLGEIEAYARQHPQPQTALNKLILSFKMKAKLLQVSRYAFVIYALVWAILGIVSNFLSEQTWVETLSYEIIEAVVYLVILFHFRLRDFSLYIPDEPRRRGTQGNGDGDEEEEEAVNLIQLPGSEQNVMVGIKVTPELFEEVMKAAGENFQRERQELSNVTSPVDVSEDDEEDGIPVIRVAQV